MEQWEGKVAVVTGASSGIGAQVSMALVRAGLIVVGMARRVEKMKELAATLKNAKGQLHAIRCDLNKEEDILKAFAWIEKELGGVDVLINNAGILFPESIINGETDHFRQIMNVNVIAMAICTRETVKSVRNRNAFGHIINMNSYAGHYAECVKIPVSLYVASKYAVTGMTHSLRNEIALEKLNIKVTSISPGAVETDILNGVLPVDIMNNCALLSTKDISDAVIYTLSTPPNVQTYELVTVPFSGSSGMSQLEVIEELSKRHEQSQ